MGVGRKVSDGEFGSYDFHFGIEIDVPPDAESIGEFMSAIYQNLQRQLVQTMVDEGVVNS